MKVSEFSLIWVVFWLERNTGDNVRGHKKKTTNFRGGVLFSSKLWPVEIYSIKQRQKSLHDKMVWGEMNRQGSAKRLKYNFCSDCNFYLLPLQSIRLLSLSNQNVIFKLFSIQSSFNLEDHTINAWRLNWKSNGKSSRKIFAGCN